MMRTSLLPVLLLAVASASSALANPLKEILPPGARLSRRPGVYVKVTESTSVGSVTYLLRRSRMQAMEILPRTETLIGFNDLQVVDARFEAREPRYSRILGAFGKMLPMGCTATHIGDGLVLTAQHCLSDVPVKLAAPQPCEGVTIQWGYQAEGAPPQISRCESILAGEFSEERDYALLRVSPAPPTRVEVEMQRPEPGTRLTLFGHPRGRPLEWSGRCQLHLADSGGYTSRHMFAHQCDSEPGSGGGALLDDETLKVVGIHGGGEITELRDNKLWGWNFATYVPEAARASAQQKRRKPSQGGTSPGLPTKRAPQSDAPK